MDSTPVPMSLGCLGSSHNLTAVCFASCSSPHIPTNSFVLSVETLGCPASIRQGNRCSEHPSQMLLGKAAVCLYAYVCVCVHPAKVPLTEVGTCSCHLHGVSHPQRSDRFCRLSWVPGEHLLHQGLRYVSGLNGRHRQTLHPPASSNDIETHIHL